MLAFVLSGGGNLGALQVGALRALLERHISPDIVVGCSAGALNATFLAKEISLEQVERLASVWRSVTVNDVYPGTRLSAVWRLLTGKDSLYDNRRFYAFLQRHGANLAQTFDQIRGARLYITATRLPSGQLHVFGDNPGDRIIDALMASTALTPMHPPWEINGERFTDGGTVTPLPVRVALERGATEIYALHIVEQHDAQMQAGILRGAVSLLVHSVSTMLHLQAQHDLLLADVEKKVKLHYMRLCVNNPPRPTDFSRYEEMLQSGYAQAVAFLGNLPGTLQSGGSPRRSLWQRVKDALPRPGRQKETLPQQSTEA